MSDIFRDLTIKQKKEIISVPRNYPGQIIRHGHWRKEQHISELIPRVLHEISKKYIAYHTQLVNGTKETHGTSTSTT